MQRMIAFLFIIIQIGNNSMFRTNNDLINCNIVSQWNIRDEEVLFNGISKLNLKMLRQIKRTRH